MGQLRAPGHRFNDDGITHKLTNEQCQASNSLLFEQFFVVIDSVDKCVPVLAPTTFACLSVNVKIGN